MEDFAPALAFNLKQFILPPIRKSFQCLSLETIRAVFRVEGIETGQMEAVHFLSVGVA